MVQIVLKTIGAGGDHATLAGFAAALPANLVAADQCWVAELYNGPADPGGVVFQTICDGTRFVSIRAAAGEGPGDVMDPDTDPLRATPGKGAMIEAPTGDAIIAAGVGTRLEIANLQIAAPNGAAVVDDGAGRVTSVAGCNLEAGTSMPAVTVTGGSITRSVVLQRGPGDGIRLIDGALAEGCTVVKPPRPVADGVGLTFAGTPAPDARSCFVSGFRRAYSIGSGVAEALVSDQQNILSVSNDFADPYWTSVAATVNPGDTVPGPYGVPMQWLGNNQNAFSRFDGPTIVSLAPGERIRLSLIVAQPSALVSAILLDSLVGRPELRVFWTGSPPGVGLLAQTAGFAARIGTVTDLGAGLWRLYLEAENTTAGAIDVVPSVYVTRDVSNSGLNVGFYAGSVMAGTGHLGTGYVEADAVPGTGAVDGVDPAEALGAVIEGGEDLRPLTAGPLAGVGAAAGRADFYLRHRNLPDTAGAVSLQPATAVAGEPINLATGIDLVRLVDQQDILTAASRRTVLPAAPDRRVGV